MKTVTGYINKENNTITVVEVFGMVNKTKKEQTYRIGNGKWAYPLNQTIDFLKEMHEKIEFLNQ